MREPAFWYRPSSLDLAIAHAAWRALRRWSPRSGCSATGFDAGIPVICVGNYHVGGAGKTPTVLALAGCCALSAKRRSCSVAAMAEDCTVRSRSIRSGMLPPMSATSR